MTEFWTEENTNRFIDTIHNLTNLVNEDLRSACVSFIMFYAKNSKELYNYI